MPETKEEEKKERNDLVAYFAKYGRYEGVKEALEKGCDVNVRHINDYDESEDTALLFAAGSAPNGANGKILELLLDNPKVDYSVTSEDETAFMLACGDEKKRVSLDLLIRLARKEALAIKDGFAAKVVKLFFHSDDSKEKILERFDYIEGECLEMLGETLKEWYFAQELRESLKEGL